MRNRLICVVVIFALFLSGGIIKGIEKGRPERVHQQIQEQKPKACTDHKKDVFCTHLPLVSITIDGDPLTLTKTPGKHAVTNETEVTIKLFDKVGVNHHVTDTPTEKSGGIIKYRGNSSIYFDKKSYKISLFHKDFTENKISFMGMPKHDEWVLNGPFLDKTLIRNYLCMSISGEIMESTPEVRLCELYMNGVYQGVYVAMETVTRGEDRVDIAKANPTDPFSSYIIRADREVGLDQELDTFSKYAMKMNLGTTTMIEYPSKKNLTPAIQEYIEKDFSRFEKMLYSYDFNQKDCGYERKINRDSFVDYMVINEFFKNMDAGIFSTYFYKDIRGKIAIGPVWDFNNACDNYMEESYGFHSFAFPSRSRYVMLLKDPPFTEAVIRRYKELRKTVLSEEYLQGFIDETVGYLGDAVGRNDEVWGYSYDVKNLDGYNKLMPDERNLESYEEAVMQLKTFITKRGSWLDENIEILRQYSHESKVKKFNH